MKFEEMNLKEKIEKTLRRNLNTDKIRVFPI
jgi:hypothetical protein